MKESALAKIEREMVELVDPPYVPDVYLMTTTVAVKLRSAVPAAEQKKGVVNSLYGIAYEEYPTLTQVHQRMIELKSRGKRVAVVCE